MIGIRVGNLDTRLWQGPVTGFLGLINWSLEFTDDVLIQLEGQSLLTPIISVFNQLPMEMVHNLTQVFYI